MPKTINDIDWSAKGGFGVPYNYEMDALAQRVKDGASCSDEEFQRIKSWAELKVSCQRGQTQDPIAWGWRLKSWEVALKYWPKSSILFISGGKRSSKSEIGSRILNRTAIELPNAYVSAWHQNDKFSIQIGQDKVWANLPTSAYGVDLKANAKKKGEDFSLTYTQSKGFANNIMILPPMHPLQVKGSEVNFKTYMQYQNDKQVAESYSSDLEWLDEEPPRSLLEATISRVGDRNGKILWTCTPVSGYGDTVAFLLDGAETIETIYSDWLKREIPLVQKSKNMQDAYIVYFPTEWNPFANPEVLKRNYSGLDFNTKLTWMYGVPTKRSLTKFPKFDPKVHCYNDQTEGVPLNTDCTFYMWCDPAGGKRWVMLWAKVDKKGNIWVEREWPDLVNYGFWSLPAGEGSANKYKGKAGPAQNEGSDGGRGYESYAELIRKIERELGWANDKRNMVFQRRIDPRGNKIQQTADFVTTTVGEMAKQGIFFFKALGPNDIEPGLQKINDYLDYEWNKPIGDDNAPKLRIHERCGNLINCMQTFTAMGGTDENSKDFIDCLRYGLMSNPINMSTHALGFKHVHR
jgi:phage terminase large subunit-like protein